MVRSFKKNKDYLFIIGISLLIFMIIFINKSIYPFGNNTLINDSISNEIIPLYYYIRDAIITSKSLFISFNSATGMNFFGLITCYLLSPFNLLTIFVARSKIYLFLSVIVVLKIVLCNMTCLYMIKKLFKNINIYLSISLALLYGFSLYSLNPYKITSLIDAMYMLPLIVVGLKELIHNNNPKTYIISLTISIYLNFIVSFSTIIFIILLSFIYIVNYIKREDTLKKIALLLSCTILSILSSLLIIVPTIYQFTKSIKFYNIFKSLTTTNFNYFYDKLSLLIFGPILFIGLILLLKNYKRHKKFIKFYLPSIFLLILPIIFEPINRILNFNIYSHFPYHFGFITILFIIIGASYYFNSLKSKEEIISTAKKILSIVITIISIIIFITITTSKYRIFQLNLMSPINIDLIYILLVLLLTGIIIIFIILIINKGFNKLSYISIFIITITNIFCLSYLYTNISKNENNIYDDLSLIYEDNNPNNYFRYKNDTTSIILNNSNITEFSTIDSFNSLLDKNNKNSLNKLGYSESGMNLSSNGGTLFTDILLGNKYVLNNGQKKYNYFLKNQYNDLYLYEYDGELSFGYLINENMKIEGHDDIFDLQNTLYKFITSDTENLFDTIEKFDTLNLDYSNNNFDIYNKENHAKFKIKVKGRRNLYLELTNNKDLKSLYKNMDIYVNGELIEKDFPNSRRNGLIDIGEYKDQEVNITVKFKRDCHLDIFKIGSLKLKKLDKFIEKNKLYYNIKFINNMIDININSDEEKILFIPITYDDSYIAYNNGKIVDVLKIFDNFIGVNLQRGENNINIIFIPKYLIITSIISLFFILISIMVIKVKLFKNIINNKIVQIISKYIYLGLNFIIILFIYILPIIISLISAIANI